MSKTYTELQKENAEKYQGLFDFFAMNHDLVLTEGQMDDVINAVKEHVEQRQESGQVDAIVINPTL
jgi:Ca2+-binding EF-hand superfamily protein